MFRNKNKKNQYGTFQVNSGYKKNIRVLAAVLTVMIFVLGAGILVFRGHKKPKVQAIVQTTVSTIPGWWYQQYFGKSVCDQPAICGPDADPDLDGLTNAQEFYYHADPLSAHTVKDTLNDGQLVAAGFDPSRPGHMTFDQVTAPDNILGDSLLVGQDFKDIVAQQNDISKVSLPLVTDDQLKITQNQSQDTYSTYVQELNKTVNKYFTQSDLASIGELLKSGTGANVEDIKTKASLLALELKAMTVPQKMLMYHKYTLTFFELLPKVLLSEGDPALDNNSAESDIWYENTQALLVVVQKLNSEEQRLNLPQTP